MIDPIDEWVVQGLTSYKDKKLISIAQAGLDLDTSEEKTKKEEEKKSFSEKYSSLIP